jgi:C4-dicarboxylate-specific signal transduction histidine kinase
MPNFIRQTLTETAPLNVLAQLGEVFLLLHTTLPLSVQISFESWIKEAMVLANQKQIQHILINLCTHAAEIMGGEQGTIAICIDHAHKVTNPPAGLDTGLCLTVSGSGMQPEELNPLLTTQAPCEENGQGLPVVYGIVSQLGGAMEINSRADGVNTGAEYRVFLPLV